MILGPHHDSLRLCTLLMFGLFHLHRRCIELRGIPLASSHAVSFDVSVLEERLHEDLLILLLQMVLEIEPKPSCP